MKLHSKNDVNIQSENIIEKILNTAICRPSPSAYDPDDLFPEAVQISDPLKIISAPSIVSERIDDIPLLVSILLKLDIPNIIDKNYTPHGNHDGLSYGWLLMIWLVYILSQGDHRMNSVQDWVAVHCAVLTAATGQDVREKDFTDDRLPRVLKMLSNDTLWSHMEQHMSRHTIRAYDLSVDKIRLDATTASVNHNPDKSLLFKIGRTKENTYQSQFKLMIGTLDPLGLPIATDVVSGEKADDPLYVPIYKRIRKILDKSGILYIGDSKMAAIETRAEIVNNNDFYLMPLPMTGESPELLDKLLSELKVGKHKTGNIFSPEDIPDNPDEAPDPKLALARGFETTVERNAKLNDEEVSWEERVCCVQSFRYASSQSIALDRRLAKAEERLQKLTPPPGRGRKQYQNEAKLAAAADKILSSYKFNDLISYTMDRQESHKNVRAYRGNPARIDTTVRYQIHTKRDAEEIEQVRSRLGWRLYVINAPAEKLSLTQVVLSYRQQYIVERNFSRLKGKRLGITPLYVQLDDHACGLIRLLTIALRTMSIIEFDVHRKLVKDEDVLQGIYPGNPARGTERPSVDLMLRAFIGLNFYITDLPNGQHFEQISPLNDVQKKILYLLDLPGSIYNKMAETPVYGLQMNTTASQKARVAYNEPFINKHISTL